MGENASEPRISRSANFVEWESALTRRFLMYGENGEAGPIRSFEVTPQTLAGAICVHGDDAPAVALSSFRAAVAKGGLVSALEDGYYPRGMDPFNVPGCLSYLFLTLLVAALPDERTGLGGNFRDKLQSFTGIDRSFSDLRGVASMWSSLKVWLEERRTAGGAFRTLILPEIPSTWKHIGYSLRLAFPTKSDATVLKNFFLGQPHLVEDPNAFVHRFVVEIDGSRTSDGMREAFADFRKAFLRGDRLLADHPLWRLARICALSTALDPTVQEARIECHYDEDGEPLFSAVRTDGARLPAASMTLSDAVAAFGDSEGASKSTLRHGYLLFAQAGYGRWRSIEEPGGTAIRMHLGCSADAYRRLREHRSAFRNSGGWYFSLQPLSAAIVDACVGFLRPGNRTSARLTTVSIADGVRTGGLWLGRAPFMPRVLALGCEMRVQAGTDASGDITLMPPDASGACKLVADGPTAGPYFVEPLTEPRRWSRRISFTRDAFVHENLDSRASEYEEITEWSTDQRTHLRPAASPSGWAEAHLRTADLVEAIYAGGRSGWDEADLVQLACDAYGHEADPWVALRMLRDATVLQPRLKPGWKGRVWTLRRPSLRKVGPIAIVDGAICERLANDFREACSHAGTLAFRVPGTTKLAPSLIGCEMAVAHTVAARLGWEIEDDGRAMGGVGPSFCETRMTLLGREPASRWDWAKGHFVADGRKGEGDVSLTRWRHVRGADHDVYTVDQHALGDQRRLLSRGAAVSLAHCLAHRPLFAVGHGLLIGSVREACLPDAVAARLRLRHVANAGLSGNSQVYPIDGGDIAWLRLILPGLLPELDGVDRTQGVEAVSSARHARGRIRLSWDGRSLNAKPSHQVTRK